jgi:hypothetical protein
MKTELTRTIEKKLAQRFINTAERFAFEVSIGDGTTGGFVDFITAKLDWTNFQLPIITCYEIKVSISDFKSENGHNLYGDFNYYVTTPEVYDWLKEKNNMEHLNYGIMVYKNDKLYQVKGSVESPYYKKPSIERRFRILDDILIKWHSGTMYRMLKDYGIDLRNN